MSRRPPSLRSIAAFEAAARHRSFARAAAELNLTTSAISHSIKALEARLQERLFDRSGRAVTLTTAGQALAVKVRLSMALLADAFDLVRDTERQRLNISTLPSIATCLGPALRDFGLENPGIDLVLESSPTLAEPGGNVDVALRFGPGGWAGFQARHLADEVLFPVAAPGTRCDSIDDLAGLPLIRQPENTWRLWFEGLGRSAEEFESRLEIDDHRAALDAAAAGAGVALGRGWVVEQWIRDGRLVRLLDHQVSAEYSYWAVWAAGSPKRALIASFVDWIAPRFPQAAG